MGQNCSKMEGPSMAFLWSHESEINPFMVIIEIHTVHRCHRSKVKSTPHKQSSKKTKHCQYSKKCL